MPSFDNLATAAMTPGGVMSGVNDLVSSILNANNRHAQLKYQDNQNQIKMLLATQGLDQKKQAAGDRAKHQALDTAVRILLNREGNKTGTTDPATDALLQSLLKDSGTGVEYKPGMSVPGAGATGVAPKPVTGAVLKDLNTRTHISASENGNGRFDEKTGQFNVIPGRESGLEHDRMQTFLDSSVNPANYQRTGGWQTPANFAQAHPQEMVAAHGQHQEYAQQQQAQQQQAVTALQMNPAQLAGKIATLAPDDQAIYHAILAMPDTPDRARRLDIFHSRLAGQ